jgi:hypothetical protein
MCHPESLPDDVGCCLPLLGQELWVVHDLLQEADHLAFELIVGLKVLWEDGMGGVWLLFPSCPAVLGLARGGAGVPAHGGCPTSWPSH